MAKTYVYAVTFKHAVNCGDCILIRKNDGSSSMRVPVNDSGTGTICVLEKDLATFMEYGDGFETLCCIGIIVEPNDIKGGDTNEQNSVN